MKQCADACRECEKMCRDMAQHDRGFEQNGLKDFIQKIKPGVSVLMEYGPEGLVGGKPKHVHQVLMLSAPFTQVAEKKAVVFDVKAQGQGAPLNNLWAGSTY